MEHVHTLDDLMLQINGAAPNEAVMKVFNIVFPYDKPLPAGRGDELALQGFYGPRPQEAECDPEVLRQRLDRQAEEDRDQALRTNQVEDIQDLLDLKRQLMALEQVNGMHVLTIQEKDARIRELQEQLQGAPSTTAA